MEYIGIDVHQRESQVCIVDEDGHVLLERRVRTKGERFAALLEGRGRAGWCSRHRPRANGSRRRWRRSATR